jgi:hypothetical protein
MKKNYNLLENVLGIQGGRLMPSYKVYEDYTYTLVYEVIAENKEEALEKILDDPYEYRNLNEDRDDVLTTRRWEEK